LEVYDMRKINGLQVAVFGFLLVIAVGAAIATTAALLAHLPLGDFRGITLVAAAIVFLYGYAVLLFRLFLWRFPLRDGEVSPGSRQEFVYHVYLLFFLILFYPVMRSGFMPVPAMRLVFQALGAKMGANTYSSGIILDPTFVTLGDNTLVGQYALLVPHVIEGERLAHYPIRIGSNVTIGAGATVLSGVTIGDNAIVSTGAVVKKGTQIGDGEIWGGVPARLIGHRTGSTTVE
jgi:acetyltransferase-like isoleucine patch superfamily enzyme